MTDTATLRARPHWTYMAYDESDTLLYIGCTNNPLTRLRTHKAKSRWFSEAVRVQWQRYVDYQSARAAEYELICALQPAHNHNRGRRYGKQRDAA